MKTLKVGSQSMPHAVATSIAEIIKTEGAVEVISIGAASLNQATKAMIYARGNLATAGYIMTCLPSFLEVRIDDKNHPNYNQERTAIKWVVRGQLQ